MNTTSQTTEQTAKKNLSKFKREFAELLGKYPEVSIYYSIPDDKIEACHIYGPWDCEVKVNLPTSFSQK